MLLRTCRFTCTDEIFGKYNASAAEQRHVFLNAIAQGGQSNWSPYDGC